MSASASGTFEAEVSPQASDEAAAGTTISRFSIQKRFHGDLEATSTGEMLGALTPIPESAGYVAIERVSGTLNGRKGSFVLQHSGTMTRGTQELTVTVVPDSGTGELEGLAGKMIITIADGLHSYEFEYSLPEPTVEGRAPSPS